MPCALALFPQLLTVWNPSADNTQRVTRSRGREPPVASLTGQASPAKRSNGVRFRQFFARAIDRPCLSARAAVRRLLLQTGSSVTGGTLGIPASERRLAGNFTTASGAQLQRPRPAAFQSAEPSQRDRVRVLSSAHGSQQGQEGCHASFPAKTAITASPARRGHVKSARRVAGVDSHWRSER